MPPDDRELLRARVRHAKGDGPRPEPDGPTLVQLDEEVFIFRVFGAELEDQGLSVRLHGEVIDGVPECTELTIRRADGQPLAAKNLRSLPLSKWLRHAVATQSFHRSTPGSPIYGLESSDEQRREVLEKLPSGRIRVNDVLLRRVADIYERAESAPTKAVQDEFLVSRSQASRYVRAARDKGFLALPGQKPGGGGR